MGALMKFSSAVSTNSQVEGAVEELATQIKAQMGTKPVNLAAVFISAHFILQAREIAATLYAALQPEIMLGCTAEGVISRDREIEDAPAISMIAAHLPSTRLTPFLMQDTLWPVMLLDAEEFQRVVGAPQDSSLFIVLADPFSTPMADVLHAFNDFYPGIPVTGGMASGALRPHGNALFLNDQLTGNGLVGVNMSGDFDVEVIVSQGCRPIWQPFIVQAADKNIIFDLEGKPPLAWIQRLAPELSEQDRLLLQNGLFVGRAIDPGQEMFGRGDFLIRGVMGVDQPSGAIAVGDMIDDGEVIQFHLRDALTAREDLEMMLLPQTLREPPQGALLFTCNGRGKRLYDYPNGDISVIQQSLGGAPLAGFFCAGEIGPVGRKNFLHGQTASLVLFRKKR
jgi:small ligand-binding sensory domain FIST